MLLQIALQDIGQLTDIEAESSRRGGASRHGPAERAPEHAQMASDLGGRC